MAVTSKRPFWLHQLAEYIVGAALIGSGLQSGSPAVPAIVGGAILVNASLVDSPLGAFRVMSRRGHRMCDVVVLGAAVIVTIVVDIDLATRITQAACLTVFAVIVLNTNYAPPGARTPMPSGQSEAIGRIAGRKVGTWAGRVRAHAQVNNADHRDV